MLYLISSLGDVLIFMPGQEEIEVTCEVLAGMNMCIRIVIVVNTLYGGLILK